MPLALTRFLLVAFSLSISNCVPAQIKKGYSVVDRSLRWEGKDRHYRVTIPESYSSQVPVPLVFALHGGGGSGKGLPGYIGHRFDELASEHNFLVVYPSGFYQAWNDGRLNFTKPQVGTLDDAGFLLEVLSRLKNEFSIQSDRVFICGISNGGWMTHRMLREHPGVFRGAALVAATSEAGYFESSQPGTPTNVLIINGTEDPLLPYAGGQVNTYGTTRESGSIVGTEAFAKYWAERAGCTAEPAVEILPNRYPWDGTTVQRLTYCLEAGARVELLKVIGGGHTWPGPKSVRMMKSLVGNTSKEIDACEEIWGFFSSL